MSTKFNEDDFTRNFLRVQRSKSSLNESLTKKKLSEDFETAQQEEGEQMGKQRDEVIIAKNDEKLQEFSKNINQFVGALRVDDRAEIVYPKDSDVVFNGVITDMNNLKFQFRYNDQSGGLYIWADSMLLTREMSEKLAKLVVIREQWKDYWSTTITQYTDQK